MGVNVEIVVLLSSEAEARAAVRDLEPVFSALFSDGDLRARAYAGSRVLIVSGLCRYVSIVDKVEDARNLGQWPQVGLAIRILAHRYGLDRVRVGSDALDLDYCPYEDWPSPPLEALAMMDRLHAEMPK